MVSLRVDLTGNLFLQSERQFRTEHRGDIVFAGGLSELHGTAETVVVCQRHCAQSCPGGFGYQFVWLRCSVEEAVDRMRVQFGIADGVWSRAHCRCGLGLSGLH